MPRTARHRRFRRLLFVGIGIATTLIAGGLYGVHALRSAELSTVDTRFSIRGDQKPPKDVAIVTVDPDTFARLRLQWPFPRSRHARVIDQLSKAGAAVIAYDIQFTEPSADPEQDVRLVDATRRARNVLLATTEVSKGGVTSILGGGRLIAYARVTPAFSGLFNDPGGVLRRLPLESDGLASLGVIAAERFKHVGGLTDVPPGDRLWIDFYGGPGTIPTYSFAKVMQGAVPASAFRGKVVIVGAAVPTLQEVADYHPTPLSSSALMSGPEIQANAIATALRGFPLRASGTGTDLLLIALLGMAAPLASLRFTPLRAFALALAVGGAYAGAVQLAFNAGTILPLLYPLVALSLGSVGALVAQYLLAAFERERVRDVFTRFVPEHVVDDVLARTENLRLGGVEIHGTVLFSDLRGFTTYSEALPAANVIDVLNRYLSTMTDTILDHGGTLTTYIGDGIMALFGGPLPHADHADRAVATAGAMLERLEEFNVWVRDVGLGDGFRMGIGLNTGYLMAGNVGSERRLEYTAIGDAVNTASRLEGMTKGTPHQVFLSESTRAALLGDRPPMTEVGELAVRGRQGTVQVWSLDCGTDPGDGERADTPENRPEG